MSGPKYSYAKIDIEKLKKQIVEIEAKVEKAKCENIKRSILLINKKTEKNISQNSVESFKNFFVRAEKIIPGSESLNYFKELIDEYSRLINNLPKIAGNSDELLNIQMQMEERNIKISNIISMLKAYKNSINNDCISAITSKKESDYLYTYSENAEDNMSNIPKKLLKEYNNLLNEILNIENFEEIKKDIDSIITNHTIDDAYKIRQLKLRTEAAKVEKYSSTDVIEYLTLKNNFIAICEIVNKPVDNISLNTEELRKQLIDLEKEFKEITMMKYISESLKAAMENLGYNIIGHEELINQNQYINRDYFDFSANSAINVSASKNGAVLFEVMGKGNGLNEAQKEAVKCDMEKFCPDYNYVKAELGKYGIILEKEKLYEPDVKYVREVALTNTPKQMLDRRKKNKQLGMM